MGQFLSYRTHTKLLLGGMKYILYQFGVGWLVQLFGIASFVAVAMFKLRPVRPLTGARLPIDRHVPFSLHIQEKKRQKLLCLFS